LAPTSFVLIGLIFIRVPFCHLVNTSTWFPLDLLAAQQGFSEKDDVGRVLGEFASVAARVGGVPRQPDALEAIFDRVQGWFSHRRFRPHLRTTSSVLHPLDRFASLAMTVLVGLLGLEVVRGKI
jgi:hypothetical protein